MKRKIERERRRGWKMWQVEGTVEGQVDRRETTAIALSDTEENRSTYGTEIRAI